MDSVEMMRAPNSSIVGSSKRIGMLMLVFSFCVCSHAAISKPLSNEVNEPCLSADHEPKETVENVIKTANAVVLATVVGIETANIGRWVLGNRASEEVYYTLGNITVLKGVPSHVPQKLAGVKVVHPTGFDPALFDASFRHYMGLAKARFTSDSLVMRQKFKLRLAGSFCEYAPYFDIGLRYLIVLRKPYSRISFEPILSAEDAWLERVQAKLLPKTPQQDLLGEDD